MRISGTKSDLVTSLIEAVSKKLPPSWRLEDTRREVPLSDSWVDAVVRLRAPDGTKIEIIVEARRRIDPVDVPGVVDQIRRLARGRSVWIVAPFLGPRTQERLKQEQVGFADTTGNMWLVLDKPALFVETSGAARDPQPTARRLASLKGRAAGRVVRALCDYKPPYGIRELAERSKTPLASVARVVALLEREAIVVRKEQGGVAECDPVALIRRWTQDYSLLKSNDARPFLEPRTLKTLLVKLKSLREEYAVTGSLAAAIRTAVLPSSLAVVFVDDVAAAAAFLGLKPVEVGANVFLASPFDRVVYERASKSDDVYYAASSQVAADLLTSPGRGPADGEDLLTWMEKTPDAWRA